jgi:hypothetical protein
MLYPPSRHTATSMNPPLLSSMLLKPMTWRFVHQINDFYSYNISFIDCTMCITLNLKLFLATYMYVLDLQQTAPPSVCIPLYITRFFYIPINFITKIISCFLSSFHSYEGHFSSFAPHRYSFLNTSSNQLSRSYYIDTSFPT